MNISDQNVSSELVPYVRFSPDFSSVTFEDGRQVTFTSLEARALSFLNRNPGRTLTRENFLDALGDAEGRRSDRSIDFLINRLRKKLCDDVRAPNFISTRYGEGYVWLPGSISGPDLRQASCVVYVQGGPDFLAPALKAGRWFGRELCRALRRRAGEARRIVWAATLEEPPKVVPHPELAIAITCFQDNADKAILVCARCGKTGHIVHAGRHAISGRLQDLATAADLEAEQIQLKEWSEKALHAETEVPVQMAAHTAANMPHNGREAWPLVEAHLRSLREQHPDDPRYKLMYASHLHARYVLLGPEVFRTGAATCAADEACIERLVLEALDYAQQRPNYAISAAKLLYFVSRDYGDIAEEMSERALKEHDRPATSLSMVAQLRAFLGRLDESIALHEQAVALSPKGSEYRSYTLILLCQALAAAGKRDRLDPVVNSIQRIVPPATFALLEPLFVNHERPSLRARASAASVPKAMARAVLENYHYLSARLFRNPAHGLAVLKGPTALYQNRFGRDVLPRRIRQDFPSLAL